MNNTPRIVPLEELSKYKVNRQGAVEVITQPLFDYQDYPTAGTTEIRFFQTPKGANGKAFADTNMEIAGSLPANRQFLVQGIELYFWPGGTVANYGGASAAPNHINDMWNISKAGVLELFIGDKTYLLDGPLGKFPPRTRLDIEGHVADSTTPAADKFSYAQNAAMVGLPYPIAPVLIESSQNFSVNLRWPAPVAVTAGARIGISLTGLYYRLSQ